MAQRSWPLVLLGLAAFIPGVGFFFGAAAVTWGLLSDRPRARLAIWLGAAGALLQLVLGVGMTLWLQDSTVMRQAQVAQAEKDLTRLVIEIDKYRAESGQYPPSLQALLGYPIPTRLVNIYDHTAGLFRQTPYIYRLSPAKTGFDLFGVGPDGKADTSDDVRPALTDSLRAATGYQPSS